MPGPNGGAKPALSTPTIPAEPVGGLGEVICAGSWIDRVEKRGGYAVLTRRSGAMTLLVDREFVEKAALALGIEVRR